LSWNPAARLGLPGQFAALPVGWMAIWPGTHPQPVHPVSAALPAANWLHGAAKTQARWK